MIVEFRIDDRLIHGQVCCNWIPHYNVDRILIIDDVIVNDEMRKTALKFGCPPSCKLSIMDTAKATEKLKNNIDRGINLMILCQDPGPLAKLVENGIKIDHVTVGNMQTKEGATHVAENAYVSAQEEKDFKKLVSYGVQIYYQIVPSKMKEDITKKFK